VISPYGFPYDDIYLNVIKKAAERAHISPQRADQASQLGFVMCQQICKLMQQADWVIADVTEENPNVYYELGLAWGFGKTVLILRDADAAATSGFEQILGGLARAGKVLSYGELLPLELPENDHGTFMQFLEHRTVDVQASYHMEAMRRQESYIAEKNISFCCREGLPDKKLYLRVLVDAAGKVEEQNRSGSWTVKAVPITEGLLDESPSDQLRQLSSSKVFVVDATHYDGKANVGIYFVLGLSHALGRDTIPITNIDICGAPSPFDVRGLWQIHFKRLSTLHRELKSILTEIDGNFTIERRDYPLRAIWDKVLKPPAGLTLLTCARAAAADNKNRPGGRTNVDKWDYAAVGELAAFLARNYRDAGIAIAPPEEKVTEGLDSEAERETLANSIEAKIQRIPNSVIIIGSPDVSDYAELVLARAYEIPPYHPTRCRHKDSRRQNRCWECDIAEPACIGKHGYLFYKTTENCPEREASCFFQKPPKGEKDCVIWYGEQFECVHSIRGTRPAEGTTFGVLTVLKDRPGLFKLQGAVSPSANRWIVLLCGFTGIATYGLAKLLTSLTVQTETNDEAKTGRLLQSLLVDKSMDLEREGAQVLLSVQYRSGEQPKKHDSRMPVNYTIVDVQPLFGNDAGAAKIEPPKRSKRSMRTSASRRSGASRA